MPIKFNNVESDLGITISESYVLITRYEGDMSNLILWISLYTSKSAFESGHRPITTEMLHIAVSELAKSNIFAYLYDNILTAPLFQQYTPTVIELPFTLPPTIVDPTVTPDPNDLSAGGDTSGSEEM